MRPLHSRGVPLASLPEEKRSENAGHRWKTGARDVRSASALPLENLHPAYLTEKGLAGLARSYSPSSTSALHLPFRVVLSLAALKLGSFIFQIQQTKIPTRNHPAMKGCWRDPAITIT